MLAQAEDVETYFVGYLDLFKEMSDALLRCDGVAGDGVWDERCELSMPICKLIASC
jgi:hypothetical protein